jgi:transcriptional regulator with XRE-family HTH domain
MKHNLGETLRKYRKQKGISQQTISEYLYISRPTYSSWEKDLCEIPLTKLLLLIRYYELDLIEFLRATGIALKTDDNSSNVLDSIKEDLEHCKKELIKLTNKLPT